MQHSKIVAVLEYLTLCILRSDNENLKENNQLNNLNILRCRKELCSLLYGPNLL